MRTTAWRTTAVVAASLILSAASPRARACGGFFCDRPPPGGAPPIAQSGENVLFVLDRDPQTGQRRVEAHIQIQYTGAADQFSWVVPVMAEPTLDAGTDLLFQRIEPPTRPSFRVTWQMDGTCQGFGGRDSSAGCGGLAGSKEAASATVGPGAVEPPPAVEVIFQGNVGPYASAVLRSDDPTALRTWLAQNGYFLSGEASLIIDQYVAARAFFVALRLQQGQDTSAIRPIILRMSGEEACLPLKLTAIAATPDVRINVWVLADGRAVPLNYTEIGVDLAKLDWFASGRNYDQLLGQAADEAGGNAFAVEYAGRSAAVGALFTVSPAQIGQLARAPDPATYLSDLTAMGFTLVGDLLQVFRRHVPLPQTLAAMGVTETDFYQNLSRYWASSPGSFAPFDAGALTADLDATVFQPLGALQGLFDGHPTLTRLATFISPEEMTQDPLFVSNSALPDVSPRHLAVAHLQCGEEESDVCHAPVRLRLEDATDVWYRVAPGAPAQCDPRQMPSYDRADLDRLPSSDVGWRRDTQGEGDLVLDNRSTISAALAKHNGPIAASLGGTCGCSVRGRSRPLGGALVLIGMLALCLRRRR